MLRGLGSRLVEVEHQTAPRELEGIAVFQEIEERPGLLSDHGLHQAVPKTSIEIELEKGGELACLEQAVRAIGRRAPRVEVHPEDALALVQLLDHALLELAVAAQAEVLGIALHLDQVAGHRPLGKIEIEQGEVGPAQRHLVADRVRLVHGGVEHTWASSGTTIWLRRAPWYSRNNRASAMPRASARAVGEETSLSARRPESERS